PPPSPVKEVPKAEGAPPAVAKVTPPEAPVPGLALPKGLEDVYFDFDKWALTDQAKNTLTAQAEFLKQNATATITIEGYADERGSTEYNRIFGDKLVLKVDTAASKLTVKKRDGNRFTFAVNAQTAFTGSRTSLSDLAKGDQVTVEFQTGGGQYTALKVTSQ